MDGPHEEIPNTPPKGDYQKAEKYINKLVTLADQDKITVLHTDLNKFDPGSIQDHYRIDLKDYQIELSHSKLPSSGVDSFVMIFTNFKNVQSGNTEKAILAFTQLSDSQFAKFKTSADDQIERRRRAEEEKRFNMAVAPIDDLLETVDKEESQGAEEKKHSAASLHTETTHVAAHHSQPHEEPAPAQETQSQQQNLSDRADNFYRAIS